MDKKRLVIVLGPLFFVALAVIILIVFITDKNREGVTITNIDSCSKNINDDIKQRLERSVYANIQKANEFNELDSLKHYDAVIRKDSCNNSSKKVKTDSGREVEINTAEVIIDIPKAEQSWNFTYDWLKKRTPTDTIVNGAVPKCIESSKIIYKDFNCSKVLNFELYGATERDPIQEYTPYTGAGFTLNYDPETKQVTVYIQPPEEANDQDAAEFTENTKSIIPYWFEKRGLDIKKYTVIYSDES